MKPKQRPSADVVVLEGDWAAPSFAEELALTSHDDSHADKLYELARGLRSYLAGANVDRVVVRRADVSAHGSTRAEGPKVRLLAEGALVAGAREEVSDVLLLSGKELAGRSPVSSKADLDARAEAEFPGRKAEAVAAALAGLA